MTQAQANPVAEPRLLEFFELSRHPFVRLSAPSQIFDSEQYSLLMSHLASATEETDCLVVLRGADGSGKTTLLNRYLGNLDDEIFFATIDDNCKTATEFYSSFLRQLGFKDIDGTLKELRCITEEFLKHRAAKGSTVLVVVDNAHRIKPVVFDQLRRINEIKVEERGVLSVVMSGNSDLSRVIKSPAMSNMSFRSHVDFHIRAFDESEMSDYIRYRLEQAGNADAITFDSEALALIHRFTGGSPGQINKLCTALLREAHSEEKRAIDEQMVRAVASNQELLPRVVPLHGKGRRKTDRDIEELITEREAPTDKPKTQQDKRPSSELEQLRQSLDETRKALRESENARKQAEAKLKNEHKDVQLAEDEADKAEKRFAMLKREHEELKTSVRELKADLKTADKLGAELERVETELKSVRDEADKMRKQIQAIPRLEEQLADRDARIATLRADLAQITDSATATQAIPTDQLDSLPDELEEDHKRSAAPVTHLEIVRRNKIEKILKIDEAPSRIMIGRDEDSDLHLDSEFVSRHHALMFLSDNEIRIEDLNSFNGTLVNLKKTKNASIRPNDLIIIGDFQIRARQGVD